LSWALKRRADSTAEAEAFFTTISASKSCGFGSPRQKNPLLNPREESAHAGSRQR
jgi:hypothetical protein